MTYYPLHPAAELFPTMTKEEFIGLKADIQAHGQRHPLKVWQGEVIDGRHRLRACRELGIEPIAEHIDDDVDPWAFVLSENLHRRHLSTSQRSMIAARMATIQVGENQHTKEGAQKKAPSQTEAARMLGVSRSNTQKAKRVLERGGDEVVKAVESGEMTLAAAEQTIAQPQPPAAPAAVQTVPTAPVRSALQAPSIIAHAQIEHLSARELRSLRSSIEARLDRCEPPRGDAPLTPSQEYARQLHLMAASHLAEELDRLTTHMSAHTAQAFLRAMGRRVAADIGEDGVVMIIRSDGEISELCARDGGCMGGDMLPSHVARRAIEDLCHSLDEDDASFVKSHLDFHLKE